MYKNLYLITDTSNRYSVLFRGVGVSIAGFLIRSGDFSGVSKFDLDRYRYRPQYCVLRGTCPSCSVLVGGAPGACPELLSSARHSAVEQCNNHIPQSNIRVALYCECELTPTGARGQW